MKKLILTGVVFMALLLATNASLAQSIRVPPPRPAQPAPPPVQPAPPPPAVELPPPPPEPAPCPAEPAPGATAACPAGPAPGATVACPAGPAPGATVEQPPAPPPEPPKAEPPKKEGGVPGSWDRKLHANIKLNWWVANYDGTLKFAKEEEIGPTTQTIGDRIDFADDFDIENPGNIPEFEAWFALGEKNRILISYFTFAYGGENDLSQSLEFGGIEFDTDTKLTTRVDLSRIALLGEYFPLSGKYGNLGLRYGFEYYIWNLYYKGKDSLTGERIEENEYLPVPIPVIGVAGNLYLPYGFGVYGSFTGLGGAFEDVSASYTDLDLGASWSWQVLYMGIGYRSLHTIVNYETDSDEFNLDVLHEGIYYSIGLAL